MTFRRILIITIILLVLVGLLFGASWIISRRTAQKNGTEPMTFREFLGIGTTVAPGQNVQNDFVAQFTVAPDPDANKNGVPDTEEDLNNNGVLDGDEDLNFNGTPDKDDILIAPEGKRISTFNERLKNTITVSAIVFTLFRDTNANSINDWNEDLNGNGDIDGIEDADNNGVLDGFNDDATFGSGTGDDDGGGFGDGSGFGDSDNTGDNGGFNNGGGFTNEPIVPVDIVGGGTTGPQGSTTAPSPDEDIPTPATPTTPPATSTPTTNACSVADTNIDFTPAEIARLNILQARFNAIAETLYDDTASDEQLSFYSSFKIKELQTAELMNYCRAKLPYINDPAMKRLVPTPFYHDSTLDANTFTNNHIATSDDRDNSRGYRPLFENPITITTFLERVFRVDIW